MNANFEKWLKRLTAGGEQSELDAMLDDLHGSFATLDQEQQRLAEIVIQAAQGFDLAIEPGKTFMDYINEFAVRGKAGQVTALVEALGIDEGSCADSCWTCDGRQHQRVRTLRLTQENSRPKAGQGIL